MSAPPALTTALADRYTIERELGRGGMATVYLAHDQRHGRKVAIKVLHPDIARSVGTERFLREIRITARLAHPHIIPLLDSGEVEGVLYCVTPVVAGGSLREMLRRAVELPVGDALRIAREVGSGLDYAHRQGYVHRDVKPENILFADGVAMLADFGIARACCAPGQPAVTEVGLALGTPEYMSPEQAAGESELSSASDQYSLACVVYEMLAGEPPVAGDSARAIMARQATHTPQPVRAARPDVPPHVERALARALAKDPAGRFGSVAEFTAALEKDDGAPAQAAERSVAVLPFVNVGQDPAQEFLSDGLTDELIDALANVAGLRVASRTTVFGYKNWTGDVRSLGSRLGVAWVLEGTVRTAGGQLRVTVQLTSVASGRLEWSRRFDRAMADVFAIQEEIARAIVQTLRETSFGELAEPAHRAPPRNLAAYELYLRGRFALNKRTGAGVAEGIGRFEQAIALDPDYAQAYSGLADAYALMLDYRSVPVAEGFARAKAYAHKALAIDEGVAEAHASLAWSLFIYDWDWAAADREFRRAIALDPAYAPAHQWYAMLLLVRGRLEEGLAEARRALELDPASVSVRRTAGWAHYYARRYDVALAHFERAVTMDPTSDETRRVQGLAFAAAGRWDEAERTLREAVALSGGGSYNLAMLGYVLGRTGRRAEAEELWRGLETRAQAEYVSPAAFAQVLLGLGEYERALDWVERAWAERRGWVCYLRVNPIVDPLRGNARFEALVKRLGL